MSWKKCSLLLIALLVVGFFIGTVSASGNYDTVPAGGTVFIGEEDLDVSACLGDATKVVFFSSGRDPTVDAPDYTHTVANPTSFYVSPGVFSGRTGNWYRDGGSDPKGTVAFSVNTPRIAVLLRNYNGNDITNSAVPRGEKVDFRIETNLYDIQKRNTGATTFDFKLKVVNPNGVTYTQLMSVGGSSRSLLDLLVDQDIWYWSTFSNTQLESQCWNTNAVSGGSKLYVAGQYRITAECNENSMKDNNNNAKSDEVTLSIAADELSITANKETISRGSQFVVSVVGIPKTDYTLNVRSTTNTATDAPIIIGYQDGVEITSGTNSHTATITTSSGGTRSIGFSTDTNTRAKKWTIRVSTITGESKYDDVSIDVKEGKVTVDTEESGVYYLGEEITLVGTNTETETIYFFATGPNLKSAGVQLDDPSKAVVDGDASTFKKATVKDDNSFELKWDTSSFGVDAGSYTIYAVSEPRNKDNLGDVSYDTVSVSFRKPYITAQIKPANVAAGDEFHIVGNAGVETSAGVAVWIMGKNFFIRDIISVEDDGSFDYEYKETADLASGQYFVVVHHPMYDNEFGIYIGEGTNEQYVVGTYPTDPSRKFRYKGAGALQGSDAATALVDAIDDSAIDDTYARATFMVDQPSITISPISPVTIGSNFTVVGKTNLAIGDEVIVEVISASFGPTKKTQSGEFSGFSGSAEIVEGENGWNKFSIDVTSDNFIEDEYIVTATAVETSTTGTTTFNVLEFVPTPTPTPTPIPTTPTPEPTTIPPTPTPTTIPPTTEPTTVPPTPTPTPKSPGFGALIALIGLGVVGYLVVRKDN